MDWVLSQWTHFTVLRFIFVYVIKAPRGLAAAVKRCWPQLFAFEYESSTNDELRENVRTRRVAAGTSR